MHKNLEHLCKEASSFAFVRFHLKAELDKLLRVRDEKLSEATIFYSSRILEVLSTSALKQVSLEWNANIFSNLERLWDYGLIPIDTLYWAHGLRRICNAVRHPMAELELPAGNTALAFLECFLAWFFCKFKYGHRVESLTMNNTGSILIDDPWLLRIMKQIEKPESDSAEMAKSICNNDGDYGKVLEIPAIISVVAEKLISRDLLAVASDLLKRSLEIYPSNVRLVQLKSLCYSRIGRYNDAVDLLEPLHAKHQNDEETIGILSGIYKRLWKSSQERGWLAKSHKTYKKGWLRDKTSAYLGINTASTALFCGMESESRGIAAKVLELLNKRKLALKRGRNKRIALNLWDQLTIAEAQLLLGNCAEAKEAFENAAACYCQSKGDLITCCNQLNQIRNHLGLGGEASWLDKV